MEGTIAARRMVVAAGAVAALGLAGCGQPRVAELYPQVAEYDGRRIAEVSFVNPAPFSADSLDDLTETEPTKCALIPGLLPFCFPGTDWGLRVRTLEMRTVGEDLARLSGLYRQTGYFGSRVIPEIEETGDEDDGIHVRFVVRRGDPIIVDSVVVEGTEGIADPDSLEMALPLRERELFDLRLFGASADTVLGALRGRGHAYAEVLRNFAVDTIQDRATVWLLAVPGPRVVVDSVLVDGLEELSRRDVERQLTFRPGDLLRQRDLRASQQNLYDLELVRFASVSVAPDSLQFVPDDSTTATVRVALAEAPEHVVEALAGFGTVECGRVRAQWTDRSVLGGGRSLTLTGSVSRIGLGDPVSWFESGVCAQGRDTELATGLDYLVSADFRMPYFVNPRNELTTTLYVERQSEPQLFQRTARGGRLGIVHRVRRNELITGLVTAEYRRTRAAALLYCFEFRVCGEEDIRPFQEGLWRNGVELRWARDGSDTPLNPTTGYQLRSSLVFSTPALLSDYDFLRATAEGAVYRSIGRGVVLAGSGRFGTFITQASIGPEDFIPPEERFFAGGASSVRGYDRFGLGPGLYLVRGGAPVDADTIVPSDSLSVTFFPTGGTSLGILNAEARFPSPFLRDLIRLALFVDAGTVGLEKLWSLDSTWRVTPGGGFRVQTPVGPIRIDLAYNPYRAPRARLFANDAGTGQLVRIADEHRRADPSFLDRLTLHIAVGQPF